MTEQKKWGLELRGRIKEAEHARVFWGARARATPELRDFEIEMEAQGFHILDESLPQDRKLIIIRAMSVALESGGVFKTMKDSVHMFRYGQLKPRKNRPLSAYRHTMRLVNEGKLPREIAAKLWVDEDKPTMVSGARSMHQIYEDECCLGYGDTLGSDEHLHILFFVKHEDVPDAIYGLGEVLCHQVGDVVVLGHKREGEQIYYNVFLTRGKSSTKRRIDRFEQSELYRPPMPDPKPEEA